MSDSTAASRRKNYGKGLLLSLFFITLLLLLTLWLAGGKLAMHFLGEYLQKEHQIQLSEASSLSLNPFLSRLSVENLGLEKEGKTLFYVSRLQLSWVLVDLFSKKVVLDEAHMDGMYLHTDLVNRRVAGIQLPAATADEPVKEKADSGQLAWQVLLPRLTYSNAQFDLVHSLAKGKVRTETLIIDLFELKDLNFSEDRISVEALLQARANEIPLRLSSRIELEAPLDEAARTLDARSSYQLSGLDASKLKDWLPEDFGSLLGILSTQGDLDIRLKGQALTVRQASQELTINQLQLGLPGLEADASLIRLELGKLLLETGPGKQEDQLKVHVQLRPELEINHLNLNLAGKTPETSLTTSVQKLNWSTEALTLDQQGDQITLAANNTQLDSHGLIVHAAPLILENATESLHLEKLHFEQDPEHQQLALTPSLVLGSTQVYLMHDRNLAASWDTLRLEPGDIHLNKQQPELTLPSLTLEALVVSRPDRGAQPIPLIQAGALQVNGIHLRDNHLRLNDILFDSLNSEAILTQDRQLHNLLDLPTSPPTAGAPAAEQTAAVNEENDDSVPPPPPFTFSLGALRLSEGSRVRFTDQLKHPPFSQELVIQSFSAGPFDTTTPDQATEITLQATTGEYGKLNLSGYLKPLTDKTNLALKGKIQEISLPPTSFYIRDALGYDIESGQLNTDFDVTIQENQLKGDTKVLLQAFELASAGSQKEIVNTGTLSLNAAVGLLTDGDGNIDLDIPLRGDLGSPTFGVSTFLTVVLKKALMVAAQEVLLQSLVPYAGVASLALEAGSQLMKVKFAPLPYQPAQVAPSAEQDDYLGKFTEVMKKNVEVQVRLCAQVTHSDLGLTPAPEKLTEEQTHTLIALGLEREKQLKAALVKNGVESARLLECKPQIKQGKDTQPEIDLDT